MRAGLAVVPLLALSFLPVAHGQAPVGNITLEVGAITGLVNGTVPFNGNVTVAATVHIDCSVIAYENAAHPGDADHFHVQPDEDTPLPPWLLADEFVTDFPSPGVPTADCASGSGTFTQTVQYPFAVTAAAPGGVPVNITLVANVADDAISDPVQVPFTVQFHPGYTLTPSAKFPLAVNGTSANFTLTVKSMSNAPAAVTFQSVKAGNGTLLGLATVSNLAPNGTSTLHLTFTGPTACWTSATVTAQAAIHPMVAGNGTSMPGMTMPPGPPVPGPAFLPKPISWTFTHTCSGKDSAGTAKAKKSPAPGFLMAFAVLGLAGLARRRLL